MRRVAASFVVAAVLLSAGCAMADRLSGTSVARHLQATGEHAEAIVLDVWDTGLTVNNDPIVGLRVRVARPGQPHYDATIPRSRVSRVHLAQVQPGLRVPVYVDRHDPSNVALGLYRVQPRTHTRNRRGSEQAAVVCHHDPDFCSRAGRLLMTTPTRQPGNTARQESCEPCFA